MEPEIENIIKDQMKKLPQEIKGLFLDKKLNSQIIEIGKTHKLNDKQIDSFQIETFLLMLGLTHPNDYKNKLETLNINELELDILVKEIKTLFSDKILNKLKEICTNTDNKEIEPKIISTPKPLDFDPRFMSMPKEVEEAIAKSGWKEKLYEIAEKYKLTVEQMGVLEDMTVKVISNEVHPDKYEEELASKITIAKEDVSSLVKDINEEILKKIREGEKESINNEELIIKNGGEKVITKEQEKEIVDEEIPLPPYTRDVLKDAWPVKPIKIEPKIIEAPTNIIEEKLKAPTASENIVSDHSATKISTTSSPIHDPYHEPIE